jgi:hypothetical protein
MLASAIPSDRSDDAFRVAVSPWRLPGADHFFNADGIHSFAELISEDCIAVRVQEPWLFSVGECFDYLPCRPLGGGVGGDVYVFYSSLIMGQHNKDQKYFERGFGHSKEVTGCTDLHLVRGEPQRA